MPQHIDDFLRCNASGKHTFFLPHLKGGLGLFMDSKQAIAGSDAEDSKGRNVTGHGTPSHFFLSFFLPAFLSFFLSLSLSLCLLLSVSPSLCVSISLCLSLSLPLALLHSMVSFPLLSEDVVVLPLCCRPQSMHRKHLVRTMECLTGYNW